MSSGRPVLYDISPPLGPETAVFPGDTPLEREVVLDLARGDDLDEPVVESVPEVAVPLSPSGAISAPTVTVTVAVSQFAVGVARSQSS